MTGFVKNKIHIICGTLAYLLGVMSLYAFAKKDVAQGFAARHKYLFCLFLALAVYLVFLVLAYRRHREDRDRSGLWGQIISYSSVLSVVMLPLLVRVFGFIRERYLYYTLFILGFFVLFAGVIILDLIGRGSVVKRYIRSLNPTEVIGLIIIFIVLLILSHEHTTYYLWDSSFLFRDMCDYTITDIFDLHKLDFWDHISYAFMAGGILCKSVFNDTVAGMNLYGRLLMLIGIYGFYKLFRLMYKEASVYMTLALTAVYGVSPYFLGMSGYNYNDTAAWYITPILTYTLFAGKWLNAFLIANYYVFTKEPCVVSYTFLVIGIYIVESIRGKKLFHDLYKYIVMALPCVMFILSSIFLTSYNEAGFILNGTYTSDKLKSFFLVNFNWLIAGMGVAAFMMIIVSKRHREYMRYAFPVILSSISFLVVSCIFNTDVKHVRYIDGLISNIYIMGSIFIMAVISDIRVRRTVLSVTGILLVLSSYYTIDPVMRAVFPIVDVGESTIVNTNVCPADGIVYNRQYQDHGYIIDMGLADIASDSSNVIFFPGNNTFYFDGMGIWEPVEPGEEKVLDEYWNPKSDSRMTDIFAPDNIPFQVHIIREDTPIKLPAGTTGYYLYTDYYGTEAADKIRNEKTVTDETDFSRHGWILHRLEFKENAE